MSLEHLKHQWNIQENVDPNIDKDLVGLLNKALASEHSAVIQYYHHRALFIGLGMSTYKEIVEHNIEEELKHIEMLTEKIVALGGTPTVEVAEIKSGSKTPKEILQNDMDSEGGALAIYYEIHSKVKDLSLRILIESIIQDEQEHFDDLKRAISKFS